MTEGAPDYADHLMGVRMWVAHEGVLRSLCSGHETWHPGEYLLAECRSGSIYPVRTNPHPGEPAPQRDCKCGIHAHYREPTNLIEPRRVHRDRWLYRKAMWGVVECMGRVIRHEKMFRVERARVAAMIEVPWRGGAGIYAKLYGVPVVSAGEVDDFMRERGVVLAPTQEGAA